MKWEAAPTGRRGRQCDYSAAAIQTCRRCKCCLGWHSGRSSHVAPRVRATMARRLRREPVAAGLDWDVPDFSTLSRRQKTLKVNIPYRGSDGPLHLLADSTGIKVEGEGEWTEEGQQTARGTVCPTKAQAWWHEAAHLAQDPHWHRRKIPGNPCGRVHRQRHGRCTHAARVAGPDPARPGDRQRHRRRCLRHAQVPRCHRRPWRRGNHPTPQERQTVDTRYRRGHRPQRHPATIKACRANDLATMERLSSPKPRRDQDALRQTLAAAPVRQGLRPSGRRVPAPCRRA